MLVIQCPLRRLDRLAQRADLLQRLVEVGLEPERYSTTSDRRQGVVVRLPGRDRTRGALLLHGHLDVVPAPEPNWIHPAFAGVIDEDEYVWGRGAVDMKDMDGMMLAAGLSMLWSALAAG